MNKLFLSVLKATVALFAKVIIQKETSSTALTTLIKWLKTISADLAAFAAGQPLPALNTGTILDTVVPLIIEMLAQVKEVTLMMPIIEEISTDSIAVLAELDPTAAATFAPATAVEGTVTDIPAAIAEILGHVSDAKTVVTAMGNANSSKVLTSLDNATNKLVAVSKAVAPAAK